MFPKTPADANPFLDFAKPFFAVIDGGEFFRQPFWFLYRLLGQFNLAIPVWILYRAIDNGILDVPGRMLLSFGIIWLALAFAGWISFQLWWHRAEAVARVSRDGDDFVATPSFAHLFQTFGEFVGTWVAIVGFVTAVVAWLFLDGRSLPRELELDFLGTSPLFILATPIMGFLIVVTTRFFAEQVRALAAIANNTRRY